MFLNRQKIIILIKKNYDLIFGFLFFIFYRFFFTWLLWHGRGVPPEPDDSYFYLSAAKNFPNVQNFEDFRLIPFSLFLKIVSFFSNGNFERAYEINFYIGSILMFIAIAYFMSKLEINKKFRLAVFLVLTLYSGSGAYHGFYWVVPSFYQLAMFFIMLAFLAAKKLPSLPVIIASVYVFTFMHPSSIYASLIFLIYPFIVYFFDRRLFLLSFKNSSVITIISLVSFGTYFSLGRLFPSAGSPESFESTFSGIRSILTLEARPQSFSVIWQEYFALLFFNPLSILAYFAIIFSCFYIKKVKILAMYLSSLVFVLASSFVAYGWRTLSFLWPITFVLIGYALIGFHSWQSNFLNKFKIIPVIAFILFFFLSTSLNLLWIKSVNAKNNYSWDRSCPSRIAKENERVYFTSLESYYAFQLHGLPKTKQALLSEDDLPDLNVGNPFVVTSRVEPTIQENLSFLENLLAKKISRKNKAGDINLPPSFWRQRFVNQKDLDLWMQENGYVLKLASDCGHFQVYKIQKA